ncbi:MAG: nucleoside-diphosphate sugar epimerase/dehydratase [Chloroflexota bacterium]|nr:nucleoside-diphosphate sugar epimerase/dehydratase [Chloroflexota bacterium]
MRISYRHIPEILGDVVLLAGAFVLAFFLRFDFSIHAEQWGLIKTFILPVVGAKLLIFYFAGIYRKMWRYASVKDFITIFWASILGTLATIVIIFFIYHTAFPRSVVALDGILAVALIAGARFTQRGIHELQLKNLLAPAKKPVLIVGAGDTGEAILREMLTRPELAYQPMGLIDDDQGKQGLHLHGVKVLGTRKRLRESIHKYQIEEVIISMPTVSREVIRDIFFQCQEAGVKCKTLPGIYQIINGTATVAQIKEVGVEDILGREPVKIDLKKVAAYISGRSVLVTGAGGSIGSELCRQISRLQPSSLIMVDQSEGSLFQIEQEFLREHHFTSAIPIVADITNPARMKAIFEQHKPSIIFHAAAYKHVPLMEANPIEAIETNLLGTRRVAEAAIQSQTERFVFISTDKAVEPSSMMGTSKALAEKLVQTLAQDSSTKFMIVRFGNVLDSSGSVVPTFRHQIAHGGPVTVTHPEMTRYFMTIPEAMQLVIQVGAMGKGGEVFVLNMGEQVPIVELARNMIRLSGFEPEKDIPIEFSGIRPGEKLHEKLFWDDEEALSTEHEKIQVVKNARVDSIKFKMDVLEMEKIINAGDFEKVQDKLSEMCITYLQAQKPWYQAQ